MKKEILIKAQVLFFASDRDLLKKVEFKDPVALVVGNTSFKKILKLLDNILKI